MFNGLLWIQVKLFTWTGLLNVFSADYVLKRLQFSHSYLALWLILVHIFPSRKVKSCICFSLSYIQCHFWWSITDFYMIVQSRLSSIYNCTIPFQCSKALFAMQNSTLPKTGSQFTFLKWMALTWGWGSKYK